jgi:hypothetical protein
MEVFSIALHHFFGCRIQKGDEAEIIISREKNTQEAWTENKVTKTTQANSDKRRTKQNKETIGLNFDFWWMEQGRAERKEEAEGIGSVWVGGLAMHKRTQIALNGEVWWSGDSVPALSEFIKHLQLSVIRLTRLCKQIE